MAGGFSVNTRQKFVQLPTLSKTASGQTLSWQLPKTGLLSKIFVAVRVTDTGAPVTPNPLGQAAIIRRIRLTANTGIDLVNVSGVGYVYLLQEMLETELAVAAGQNTGRSAVAAGAWNADFVLPIAINSRDPLGMVMLQNEQTILTLSIDFETDANMAASGITSILGTVTPTLELFTVPVNPQDWPPLNMVHQILEDSQAVSGAGQVTYYWQRGNTYLQVAHGLGIGVSGADNFSRYQLRVNQSDYLTDSDLTLPDMLHRYYRGRARPAGGIYVDLMGSSGLGNYGSTRDLFNSALVTDLASVITATTSGTLYTMRRQLVLLT